MLFPTTLVGSYPQPEWLIDRAKLAGQFPPRVRARELWRVPEPLLAEAQDDATIMAIKAQEEAGLDIVTDGEIRRESYSNRFATALDGVDLDNPGSALDRSGHPDPRAPNCRRIRRRRPVEVDDLQFLKRHTTRMVKMTVPGPFTMSQQAQNDFYPSPEAAAMDYAIAVNAEIKDLFAAGADVVQIDEPYMQARPAKAEEYGLKALNAALDGVVGTTTPSSAALSALHFIFLRLRRSTATVRRSGRRARHCEQIKALTAIAVIASAAPRGWDKSRLRLLAHRERARHGHLDHARRVAFQELQVVNLDPPPAANSPDDSGHGIWMSRPRARCRDRPGPPHRERWRTDWNNSRGEFRRR